MPAEEQLTQQLLGASSNRGGPAGASDPEQQGAVGAWGQTPGLEGGWGAPTPSRREQGAPVSRPSRTICVALTAAAAALVLYTVTQSSSNAPLVFSNPGAKMKNLTAAVPQDLPPSKVDPANFVRRDGAQLMLGGKPFYFAGFNNYYMLTRAADPWGATRLEVTETFQKAQELGLTVLRMWAFADGPDEWMALQPELGFLDERVATEGLDWVVSEAREYGIRLLLTFTNGDEGYGGMQQYVDWADGTNVTDFYTNPKIKAAFKNYMGAIITRQNSVTGQYYRDDATILGWELANEPSNPGDTTGAVLEAWIEEMAAYVKTLDPNHLVAVGLIGWFGSSTPERLPFNAPAENVVLPAAPWHINFDAACLGTDFVRHQRSDNIDVMMLHMYPDHWLKCSQECKTDWAARWLRSHFEEGLKLQKPVILGEFGTQQQLGLVQRAEFYAAVYNEVEAWNRKHGNMAGTLLWMLATDSYPNYDSYMVYTTKAGAAQPPPKPPTIDESFVDKIFQRRTFMQWEAALKCMEHSSQGLLSAAHPSVRGWNNTLQLIELHSKTLAANPIKLPATKAAG